MAPTYFDAQAGHLRSDVFSSPEIHKDEIARLFRRAWLLVAPLSWVERPGDFVTTYLGDSPALAWRGPGGAIEVFLNTCLASNEPITSVERGRADVLTCPCHGWNYSPSAGPGVQRPDAVSQVEQFGGFIFASRDDQAPPLREWMNDFAWCWELMAKQFPGGIEVYGSGALRTDMACNWKLAAEAYAGDVYSDLTLTKATRELLSLGEPLCDREGFQITAGPGAMVVLTEPMDERDGEFGTSMTPVLATLFPNLSYDGRAGALHVWHPLGATKTAAQSYCLVGRDEAGEVKDARRKRFQRLFGPTGMLSRDYDNAWSEVTRATSQARSHTLNLEMALGGDRASNLPGRVSDIASEMNQRSFYGWWQSQLDAPPLPIKPGVIKMRARRGT